MASYYITFSVDDDEGDPADHFKTRAAADARLADVKATGRFARLEEVAIAYAFALLTVGK